MYFTRSSYNAHWSSDLPVFWEPSQDRNLSFKIVESEDILGAVTVDIAHSVCDLTGAEAQTLSTFTERIHVISTKVLIHRLVPTHVTTPLTTLRAAVGVIFWVGYRVSVTRDVYSRMRIRCDIVYTIV